MNNDKVKTYEYKKFMRNGGVKTITAVVRSRSKKKDGKTTK